MENNLREVVDYLIKEGEEKVKTFEIDGKTFANRRLEKIEVIEPMAAAVTLTTLTGLIDYIKAGVDGLKDKTLILHVVNPELIYLQSEMRGDKRRETYIQCEAILPNNITIENFMDTERFSIMLQSSFVENEDRNILLKIVGNIVEDTVRTTVDDGVSQMVTAKTGVATQGNVVVPNSVTLAPFRTFPEVQQPESKFVFRLKEGPKAALFQADGGAWRNETMKRIKDYLETSLKELPNIKIIS